MNLTRQEAISLGYKRYLGKPCKYCQGTERLVSSRQCIACEKQRVAMWHKDNPDYARKWREANPEAMADYSKKWREENREASRAKSIRWRKNNSDKVKAYTKEFRARPEIKASETVRDFIKRIKRSALEGKDLPSKDVGYSPEEFVQHIESLWQEGMSWANHGDWHIDHIKPISAFIKEGVQDPAVINALNNLQPLWAQDNLRKSSKFELATTDKAI